MGLREFLQVLRKYKVSIIAVFFTALISGVGWTLLQKPIYSSSASVFISTNSEVSPDEPTSSAKDVEQQVTSFASVVTTEFVLDPVIEELGLDTTASELSGKIKSTAKKSTSTITIEVRDGVAEDAAAIANATANSLVNSVEVLSPEDGDGQHLVSARVIDKAGVPVTPVSPQPKQNLLMAAALGLILGVAQALLREIFNKKVDTKKDLEETTEVPVLGVVGQLSKESVGAEFFDATAEEWANQEAYRRLRANVRFLKNGSECAPSIVFTSATPGEGKTTTAINLAWVLAQSGKSVLLVDADLRNPKIAQRLKVDTSLGLSDVLTGRGQLNEFTVSVLPGTLAVLPAGTISPNPSDLLGSDAMDSLIREAEKTFDYVLFDAPSILPVTDAVELAAQTSGVILVARASHVKQPQIQKTCKLLEAGSADLLGTVLNGVSKTNKDPYSGYQAIYQQTRKLSAS